MVRERNNQNVIGFFLINKFSTGFFSCLYTAAIVFFILLAIFLYFKNPKKIDPGGFIFIALPALVLIFIVLVTAAERGKWWLKPHWLWTSFKQVAVDKQKKRIKFVTGFWPLLSTRTYFFDAIDSLVLTSRSAGLFEREERFGLEIKLRDGNKWTFFTLFKDEQEFREKVRKLSALLDIQISDLTYGSPTSQEIRSSKLLKKIDLKKVLEETSKDAANLKIPKGITEERSEGRGFLFVLSRRHEWLAFVLLFIILVMIYLFSWVVGWTSPKKVGGWEGLCILFAAVLLFLFITTVVPVKRIILDNSFFIYRQHFLGIPITRKKVSFRSVTKITRQARECITYRLVIVTDRKTIKVNNLNRDMALYLEEQLSAILKIN